MQAPFNIPLQSLHRTSDYAGAVATDVHAAVLWAQRDRAEAYFELETQNPARTAQEVYERFLRLSVGVHLGALAVAHETGYVGIQQFTWDAIRSRELAEISMDYVYVNPEGRGRGLRDRMQTCLLGAALLTTLRNERDLQVVFREVKNPNNVERYLQAGLEPFMEPVQTTDDDETFPFSYLLPDLPSRGPLPPASYKTLYSRYAFRAHLDGLGLVQP